MLPWGFTPGVWKGRDLEQDLAFVEKNLGRAVAVGEVGLDFRLKESRKDPSHRKRQEDLLRRLLSLGRDLSKPVIIHARGAWEECLRLLLEEQISKAVFHWFSGPLEILRDLLHHGYLISATPAAHYSEKHQSAIREAPLERILLETDCPEIYEGRRSEPADVVRTLQAVARIKEIPESEVANVTTKNAVSVFRSVSVLSVGQAGKGDLAYRTLDGLFLQVSQDRQIAQSFACAQSHC